MDDTQPSEKEEKKIPLTRCPPPSPETEKESLSSETKRIGGKTTKVDSHRRTPPKRNSNSRKSPPPRKKISVPRSAIKLKQRTEKLIEKKDWNKALALSRKLCSEVPNSIFGYINVSLCLHELGKTAEAKGVLLDGPNFLKDSPLYHYNLACYETQLGDFEKAKQSLRLSFEIDESYRELAKTDLDLADFPIHLLEQLNIETK